MNHHTASSILLVSELPTDSGDLWGETIRLFVVDIVADEDFIVGSKLFTYSVVLK